MDRIGAYFSRKYINETRDTNDLEHYYQGHDLDLQLCHTAGLGHHNHKLMPNE